MAAKNSVRIIHFCKSIVEEKSYAHSVWSRSHHPPCDPKPYHKECAFACHSQLKCPLYKSSSDIWKLLAVGPLKLTAASSCAHLRTCPPKVTKLFLCTVSCLGKRFQEARVHLRMGLSLAGLDMTTMYRWRNFDFQRHWKAIAFLPHLLKWEVDFYSQISCASTHQFVQGLVHFKAALSISWLKKIS